MKIHISEVRGAGSAHADYSIEFLQVTKKGLDSYIVSPEKIDFFFYFTKTGKKTVRALHTDSDSEALRFIKFVSLSEEFFEANENLWTEIEVTDKGWVKRN